MATQANETPVAPKKGRKLLFILATLVVLGASGGGGAWYFMRTVDPHAASSEPDKPAVFLPLESFTVNLAPQDGQPQYLQAGLTLKLGAGTNSEVLKDRMPEIRNRILMVFSGRKSGDLLPVQGKQKLAIEIANAIKEVTAPRTSAKVAARPAPAPAPEATAEAGEAAAAEGAIVAPAAAAPVSAAAAPTAGPQIEVLFTSFIIQ